MSRPVIHLLSVSGHCRPLLERLRFRSYSRILSFAQQVVGEGYQVTGNLALMNPWFDENRGGRRDDAERVADVNRVLADDHTVAVVALRGGAWLTRILPDVDFDALRARRRPLCIFGFSELTTLVNITAAYPAVRAFYDHDLGHLQPEAGDYRAAVASFLKDVVAIINERPSARPVRGILVRGAIPPQQRITVVGGNLTVLVALLGSAYDRCLDLRGKWLALEDIHNDPYGIDRHLAQLKLRGAFDACAGLLIGDFHLDDPEDEVENQTQAVLELLRFHIPCGRDIPIVAHCSFGHCHPAGSLPINRPVVLRRTRKSGGAVLIG